MTSSFEADRQQLHHLVDSLTPEQLPVALRYLNGLSIDPLTAALLNAPLDDEPYTEEQRRSDALAEAAIANGEGIPHEEVLQELGA
jgi:hypothetical protein